MQIMQLRVMPGVAMMHEVFTPEDDALWPGRDKPRWVVNYAHASLITALVGSKDGSVEVIEAPPLPPGLRRRLLTRTRR